MTWSRLFRSSMGAARVTSAAFEQMHRLYNELGNAVKVARCMGRSVSIVRRHIKTKGCPTLVRHTTKELIRKVEWKGHFFQ